MVLEIEASSLYAATRMLIAGYLLTTLRRGRRSRRSPAVRKAFINPGIIAIEKIAQYANAPPASSVRSAIQRHARWYERAAQLRAMSRVSVNLRRTGR